MHSGELWAITSYFNPANYERRRSNYRAFRETLRVPLVAVELGYGRNFELGPADAEIHVPLRGGDVLWQKERLLNVALRSLPSTCDRVAWIDCDVVFERENWPAEAARLLDRVPLIQLFSELVDLPPGAAPGGTDPAKTPPAAHSLVFKMENGAVTDDDLRPPTSRRLRGCSFGAAWAARRELLDAHGFYDSLVVGSGDRAMACAAYGRFDDAVHTARLDEPRARHYRAWAEPYFADVRGRVLHVGGRLFHLWHGSARDRRYVERHERFGRLDFDPRRDVAIDAGGGWRWSTDKPALHHFVRAYFLSRNEDGREESPADPSSHLRPSPLDGPDEVE